MDYQRKWLEPRRALDRVSTYVTHPYEARRQLFLAVVEGTVRVRYQGRELKAEEQWHLRNKRHSDDLGGEPFALPFDIELSAEDVQRIWNEETLPVQAPQRKKPGPKPGAVSFAAQDEALWPEILKLMAAGMTDRKAVSWLHDDEKLVARGGTRESVIRRVLASFRNRPVPEEGGSVVSLRPKSG